MHPGGLAGPAPRGPAWCRLARGALPVSAQNTFLDCSCLDTQAVLVTTACQALVPDLCQFTNCFRSSVVPPPVFTCTQNPAAGTPVGPGVYSILVTVMDASGVAEFCPVRFEVKPVGRRNSVIVAGRAVSRRTDRVL